MDVCSKSVMTRHLVRIKTISYREPWRPLMDLLVLLPDPSRICWEGVWQHVIHCHVQKEFHQLLNHVLMFTQMVIIGGVRSYLHAVVLVSKLFFALLDHGAVSVLCLACGDEALPRERRVMNGINEWMEIVSTLLMCTLIVKLYLSKLSFKFQTYTAASLVPIDSCDSLMYGWATRTVLHVSKFSWKSWIPGTPLETNCIFEYKPPPSKGGGGGGGKPAGTGSMLTRAVGKAPRGGEAIGLVLPSKSPSAPFLPGVPVPPPPPPY